MSRTQLLLSGLALVAVVVLGSVVAAQGSAWFTQVAIGTSSFAEALHIDDGNIFLESDAEAEFRMVRNISGTGISGPFVNPAFRLGRIIAGGDGDPEFRVLYSDESTPERAVFEFDRKGIVASVKSGRGSHFEGFLNNGDSQPVFRLNSFPDMQLELGQGGTTPTDAFIRRCGPRCVIFPGAAVAARTLSADDVLVRVSGHAESDVEALPARDAIEALAQLDPVMYVKRDAANDRRMGFRRESLEKRVGAPARDEISPMELVALLTKVVQEQQQRIDALERQVNGRAPTDAAR